MSTAVVKIIVFYQKILRKLSRTFRPDVDSKITYPKEMKKILNGTLLNAIDIGGAVDLQPHWYKIVGNSNLHIFEPHPDSYEKLLSHYATNPHKDLFHIYPVALSGTGGKRTLSMTNAPTGSTIVTINENSPFIEPGDSYFFPIRKTEITTSTLKDALAQNSVQKVDIVKLDIQGAELEVLASLGKQHIDELLCFEMEINLNEIYLDGTSLKDVLNFLDDNRFSIFDVRVARSYTQRHGKTEKVIEDFRFKSWSASVSAKACEFDIVCFKKPEEVLKLQNAAQVRKLICCYCVYNFFLEGIALAEEAHEKGLLSAKDVEEVRLSIFKMEKCVRQEVRPFSTVLNGLDGISWGQYMWLKYPTT